MFVESKIEIVLRGITYKNRLLLRYIHHFKSDLIINIDHMRILGNKDFMASPCLLAAGPRSL